MDLLERGRILSKEIYNLSFMEGIYYEDVECISRAFYYANRICTLNKFSVYNYVQRPNSIMSSPFNYKKLDSRIKAAFSIWRFNKEVTIDSFNYYYKKIYTDFYITGIGEIVKNKVPLSIAKKYIQGFKDVGEIPIIASSIQQRISQYVLINFPILYIWLRQFI